MNKLLVLKYVGLTLAVGVIMFGTGLIANISDSTHVGANDSIISNKVQTVSENSSIRLEYTYTIDDTFRQIGLEPPESRDSIGIKAYQNAKEEVDRILIATNISIVDSEIIGYFEYNGFEIVLFAKENKAFELIWDGSFSEVHIIEPQVLGSWSSPVVTEQIEYVRKLGTTDEILTILSKTVVEPADCGCESSEVSTDSIQLPQDSYIEGGIVFQFGTVTYSRSSSYQIFDYALLLPENDGFSTRSIIVETHSECQRAGSDNEWGEYCAKGTFWIDGDVMIAVQDQSTEDHGSAVGILNYYHTYNNYGSYGYVGGDADWVDCSYAWYDLYEAGAWITVDVSRQKNQGGYADDSFHWGICPLD